MQALRRFAGAAATPSRYVSALAFALALVLLAPATSVAREWIVPVDAPTVAAGIDSAQAGDIVTLVTGTYYEYDLVMKSDITLRGETGDVTDVVIDAMYMGRVLTASSVSASTRIEDITFTHGNTNDNGGGMYLDASYLTVENCRISSNQCYQEGGAGGGVYVIEGAPTFEYCQFDGNTTASPGSGGAIHIETADPTITGCHFISNSAETRGGAISMVNSAAVLTYCVVRYNDAPQGAAIAAASSTPTIDHCTIARNSASGSGGTLALLGTSFANIDNTIMAFGQGGGSVYTDGSGFAAMNCSDVFGNVGGDYISFLSGMNGFSGNFSEDPLFCNPDVTLGACSPCVDAPGCEQVGALGVGCTGRTWVVPVDAPTIAAAIDSAAACDTVFVPQGTYFEQNLVMKSGVVLIGETSQFGDPTTVIDGQAYAQIMRGTNLDDTTVIENIRFAYGDTTGVLASGGALSLLDSGVLVRNCVFANNTADVGGAVEIDGGSPMFEGCDFDSNEGYDSAGAVVTRNGAVVVFDGCRFSGNQASGLSAVGGALSCYTSSDVTFYQCSISYNETPGGGAAIYAHSSSIAMNECTLVQNIAGMNGGALSAIDITLTVSDCTIARNEAPNASGLLLGNASSALVENSIIAFGVSGEAVDCYGGATADLNCCDVYGNDGGDYSDGIVGQNGVDGNISEDPLFCTGGEGYEYTIQACSPCADGGGCGPMGALGVGCGGRTWWVPDDAPTIAAAIDSAAACDTVYVQKWI
ncbi:MAG: right-handed parallel beta-helix repeat-containing protein, partial [Candidatus Eisenbacteria bacterium]